MLGIILCGGKSQRMGKDKGLIVTQGKTWAKVTAEKMNALNIPVKISVSKTQFEEYTSIFSTDDLIVDDDSLLVKGPLLGLLSCHLSFADEDIFLLACDMPLMETSMLQSLYKIYQKQIADVYIFTNDREAEPLCGIYTAKGLAVIFSMLNKNALIKHSMKYMLEHLTVSKTALQEEVKHCFRNFNTASEIM